MIDAKGLAAARGGRVLFSDFEILVRRGERIGVVGPNGAGKSTLIKLMAGIAGLRRTRAPSSAARTSRRGTSISTSATSTRG